MLHQTSRILVLLLILVTGMLWNCKKSPVEPEKPQPGRRDYVWTVDTLDMPMNWIDAVWGASPNDVWAVGAGGTYNDRLLHYDGETWTTYNKEPIWCTGNVIFGFSEDDIWMGGGAGWVAHGAGIWHYDGAKWSQNFVYDIEGSYAMEVQDIWGPTADNIYASGIIGFYDGETEKIRGFVLHYDGKQWKEILKAPFASQFLTVRETQDKVYLFSGIHPTYEFFEFDGDKLMKLYSGQEAYGLHIVDGKTYFVIDNSIYLNINGSLENYLSFEVENFGHQIFGRTITDIFLAMKDGLAHYNGTDIQYIYRFPKDQKFNFMKNVALMKKDMFIPLINFNDSRNMVLHGKLKE